jgi:hypothetical protein
MSKSVCCAMNLSRFSIIAFWFASISAFIPVRSLSACLRRLR